MDLSYREKTNLRPSRATSSMLAFTLGSLPPGSAGGWTRGKPPPLETLFVTLHDAHYGLIAGTRSSGGLQCTFGRLTGWRTVARQRGGPRAASAAWLAPGALGSAWWRSVSLVTRFGWGASWALGRLSGASRRRSKDRALVLSLTGQRRAETPASMRASSNESFAPEDLATVEALVQPSAPRLGVSESVLTVRDGGSDGDASSDGRVLTGHDPTDGLDGRRARLVQESRSSTRAVHGGERAKGGKKAKATTDSLTTPIVQSATFTFRSTQECIDYNLGKYPSFEYGRYGNPTTRAAEEKLLDLECGDMAQHATSAGTGAYDALLSASGMNAVTTMLFALFTLDGAHGHGRGRLGATATSAAQGCLITTTDCYRRTRQFMEEMMPRLNVRVVIIDPSDLSLLETTLREIRESPVAEEAQQRVVFFSESPTNPLLRLVDVPRIVTLGRQYNMIVCIDSTFATPINHRPLALGADLVLHSATKYLGGHNDILAGALVGRADLIAVVRRVHGILGGVIDPHASYLLLRGMKTLKLRIDAHNQNAAVLARRLAADERIACVHWPGLEEHPDYHLGRRLLQENGQFAATDGGAGFGGVLSFELRGHLRGGSDDPYSAETFRRTGRFIDALRLPYIGPSLGGTETLVEQVCIMGYFDQPLWRRRCLGITCGLVRFSCGIEDADDIVQDVMQALDKAFEPTHA